MGVGVSGVLGFWVITTSFFLFVLYTSGNSRLLVKMSAFLFGKQVWETSLGIKV